MLFTVHIKTPRPNANPAITPTPQPVFALLSQFARQDLVANLGRSASGTFSAAPSTASANIRSRLRRPVRSFPAASSISSTLWRTNPARRVKAQTEP
ncbi:hypothetical protein AXF42_Ash021228 [Apostasia shenzhenica]|uniref:Uncharacterized protein n=1 Tax=Apostasia shenzhenica TaxID=1088818 RepID=A0A2I0A582_9ASPA|nr:hypothetical protein AXF42_Ash021228 [Apostasia shenzhenica]